MLSHVEEPRMSAALEPLERAKTLAPRCYTSPEHSAREVEGVFLSHLEKCNWQFHRWLAERVGE